MLKQFRLMLFAIVMGWSFAGQANANTFNLGDLTGYHPGYGTVQFFNGGAAIDDTFNFTIPSTSTFAAIVANLTDHIGIDNLMLTVNGPSISATFAPSPEGFIRTGFLTALGGAYSAEITGTANPNGAIYSLQMNATIAPVPEPSTWGMLLGGLALVGFMTKRRSSWVQV